MTTEEPIPQEIKISKRPQTQKRVEQLERALREKHPSLEAIEINQLARSKTADQLRISRLRKEAEDAREKSTIDGLTGLLNRGAFDQRLEQEIARTRRQENNTVLIFLDVNKLKIVNDEQGHAAGDILLRNIADSIRKNTRIEDVAARWGGDEFAVILVNTPLEMVDNWWNRINAEFESKNIRISAGAASLKENEPTKVVDDAMYEAKKLSERPENNNVLIVREVIQ